MEEWWVDKNVLDLKYQVTTYVKNNLDISKIFLNYIGFCYWQIQSLKHFIWNILFFEKIAQLLLLNLKKNPVNLVTFQQKWTWFCPNRSHVNNT